MDDLKVVLDSGAYTAWRKNKPITVEEYQQFLTKHKETFPLAFTLDVIGEEKRSFDQWLHLWKSGHKVIPVYHLQAEDKKGDAWDILKKYLSYTGHIGIGAIANLSTTQRLSGLRRVWEECLTDDKGNPIAKVHGLGLTAPSIMTQFPWHSVDSNSPTLAAAYGKIYLPSLKDGGYDFLDVRLFATSSQSKHRVGNVGSYVGLTEFLKLRYLELFEKHGFVLGKIQNVEKRRTRNDRKLNLKTQQGGIGLIDIQEEDVSSPTLANSWEERLRWNLKIVELMQSCMPFHKLSGEPSNSFQTTIYSVCSSSGHLEVFKKMPAKPKMLVSYAYVRSNETYLNRVIKYQKQK